MARLDRLGPAREVAQIAAAVGRDFSYDLLRRLERRATTKNNENQSVCDRFSIVYLLYWNFLPRLGKLLNTRWNFELGDGDARFWSAHGTSTNPFEEGRKYRKTTFPSARGLWRISQRLIELGLSAKKTGAKVKT